jgi:general secretion pathway protein D
MFAVRSGRCRGSRTLVWVGAPVLALALLAGAARADPSAGTHLELDLRDVPLVTAINLLIAQSGAEISFVDPDGKLQTRKVEFLTMRPKSVEEALQKICRAAGCYFEKEPGGEYVISPQPLTPPRPAAEETLTPSSPMLDSLPRTEEINKIRLKFSDPRDVKAMLENSTLTSRSRVVRGMPRSARELQEMDVVPGTFDGTTGDYIPPPLFSGVGGRVLGPAGATGAGQFFGGFDGGAPGGVGGIGGGGIGGLGGGGLGGPGGIGGGAGGAGGGGLVPSGILGIYSYPLDNSLIVRGDPDAIQDLKRVIQLIDIPPRQIQIKVEQIRIETSAQKSLGVDWEIQGNDISINSNLGNSTSGSINVAVAGNNFRANLAALLTTGKATIVDSATVSTMNNVPAVITAFSQSFVFLPTRQQIQGAGLVTTFTPVPLVIPTTLFATPRVNGDGTITMFIPFMISRPSGESVGPDGTRLPNQISTQLAVLRRVPSGSTVVIGALSNRDDSESTNRIPLLSELPIIGKLFQSKLQRKNDGETLFFFTPTLLPDLPGQSEAAP